MSFEAFSIGIVIVSLVLLNLLLISLTLRADRRKREYRDLAAYWWNRWRRVAR